MQRQSMFFEDSDRFSFEDSDRFEEDSICSWISEPESVVNNWRGWRKNNACLPDSTRQSEDGGVLSLTELAAQEVAASIPFELVELYPQPIEDRLQIRIAYWSFPEHEEDIRLYSCLANGSADEFVKGEHLTKIKAVKDPLQIGFHLLATVTPGGGKPSQSTSVTFDRKKIVSCSCSCNPQAEWCAHVVALCLHRIHQPKTVELRAPVSESLGRLDKEQFQKFSQYLIAETLSSPPRQILTTAQRILDELLSNEPNAINQSKGAPDPTLGGSIDEATSWYLDGKNLKENIKKILTKFCVPAPIVFSDVNYLSTTAPPSASEWCSFLRPLRGREPEGMWNLLSIVREMFRRNDRNSIPLLEIITQQCLEANQIMVWWFNTKVVLNSARGPSTKQVNSNAQASQNACSSLCDEIVTLWKLAALNPCISPKERNMLRERLVDYHNTAIGQILANQQNCSNSSSGSKNGRKTSDLEMFPGFKSAIEACMLDWEDYPIPGVTYGHNSHYLCPFAVFKLNDTEPSHVNSSAAVLRCEYPGRPRSNAQATEQKPNEDLHQPNSLNSENGANSDEGMGEEEPVQDSVPDEPNREANEEAGEANEPPRDDNYEVYYYDSKNPSNSFKNDGTDSNSKNNDRIDVYKNLRTSIDDPFEVKFMRAEGIYAHGYHSHACRIAVALAQDLLKSPPNFTLSSNPNLEAATTGAKGKKKRVSAASHALTHMASTTLSHCAFLCTVLNEVPDYHSLAFQVGMFGIEMARPPASTKPMEVKLAHQESELVNLLKKIPLGQQEITILRERATRLREGSLSTLRGEALLPLMLASYIFESLVTSNNPLLVRGDEQLGFEACVTAIGLKANVSEAEHPLLCEGTRRQRGDLALMLLVHYKDQPEKLAKIMDKLLDKDIHQLMKSPIQTSYYVQQPQRCLTVALRNMNISNGNGNPQQQHAHQQGQQQNQPNNNERWFDWEAYLSPPRGPASSGQNNQGSSNASASGMPNRSSVTGPGSDSGSSGNSSADSMDSSASSKHNRHYPHEDSPDLSAANVAQAPVSLAAAASLSSSSVVSLGAAAALPTPPLRQPPSMTHHEMSNMVRTSLPNIKMNRFKKRAYPSVPNQPSESLAHFMFELAKQVLTKAGGTSSTSLFTQPSANQNHRGPHRALHMCAFQIGLYALGLHNRVSPNWLSRTYSSHVSWIGGQAMEIGVSAISFLIGTWEGHLTPPEAASMADKASKTRDNAMIRAAAELALSVLPHAAALNQSEIQRGIQQCKEESEMMLEKACEAVEKAARSGGVFPEVMFEVAKHWYELHNKHLPIGNNAMATPPPSATSQPPPVIVPTSCTAPPSPEALMAMAAASGSAYPMPFPVYGLIPGFQGHPNAGGAPLHMYVSPQAAAVQQVVAAAVSNAANMQPATTTTGPPPPLSAPPANNVAAAHAVRFNMGQMYHFAAAGPASLQLTPLLQAPPQMQHPAIAAAASLGVPVNPAVSAAAALGLQHAAQAAAAHAMHHHNLQHPPPQTAHQEVSPAVASSHGSQQNLHHGPSQHYLMSAYRVGMLALESLGRRVSEDRPQVKFSKTPSYGDDVRWLMTVARKLGLPYLQTFLAGVMNTVISPFLLQDLTFECAKYFALSQNFPGLPANQNPSYTAVVQQIRANPSLMQMVNLCYRMYYQCIHQKLFHLTTNDYEDFVNILVHARRAFHWTPEGVQSYSQLLLSIKRNKSCKRDLWNKIEMTKQEQGIPQL